MTRSRDELLAAEVAARQEALDAARGFLLEQWADTRPVQVGRLEEDLDGVVEAALHLRQLEHEADLERARLRSYEVGALVVIDALRARLNATAGVPSRQALQAFLASMERTEGGRA